MPAAVIPISAKRAAGISGAGGGDQRAVWSLLEMALPGSATLPLGILLVDADDRLHFRMVSRAELRTQLNEAALSEQDEDILDALPGDFAARGRESGGVALLAALEESASHFLRVTDRAVVSYAGSPETLLDRLFAEHVSGEVGQPAEKVIPFVTHLPLYGLRAAATRFGESMESTQEEEGWVRTPERLRLTQGMFVAQVVGRSMEPRIPDGSYCVFRAPVTGSRQGRLVLIENFAETDFASRFTVKRYARHAPLAEEGEERTAKILLEPLNREFQAFELDSDRFRVIAEFVEVLPS